mgnify:CR=1 FL=1
MRRIGKLFAITMIKYIHFISISLLALQVQAQQSSLDSQRIKVLKEVAVAASLKTTQLSKLNLSEMDLPQELWHKK